MNKIKFKQIPNKERINIFVIKSTLRELYAKNKPTHLNFITNEGNLRKKRKFA